LGHFFACLRLLRCGTAQPEANFVEANGSLWIAKFPAKDDRYDVGAWELVARNLAHRAGIWMPEAQGLRLTDRHLTYCAKRFDREGQVADASRRMFSSAMTLLEYIDGEAGGSYLDLAEFISNQGTQGHVDSDLEQLFRRVLFNIRVGNRDDHLRNHGFIRTATGWRLAPAYDSNPTQARPTRTYSGRLHGAQTDQTIDRSLHVSPPGRKPHPPPALSAGLSADSAPACPAFQGSLSSIAASVASSQANGYRHLAWVSISGRPPHTEICSRTVAKSMLIKTAGAFTRGLCRAVV